MLTVQFKVTALKDEARIFGLVLPAGHKVDIDVEDGPRFQELQRAVDRGDVAIEGFKPTPAIEAPAPEKTKK
jgi:hypothetical protein